MLDYGKDWFRRISKGIKIVALKKLFPYLDSGGHGDR